MHGAASLVNAAAVREFDGLVDTLRQAGVTVFDFDDTDAPRTPDAIFPNNWISFHASGRAVLYPMHHPSRRAERRLDLIPELVRRGGFAPPTVWDLSVEESKGRALEGTGSVVFDHRKRRAYAAVSPRTDPDLFQSVCERFGYEGIVFSTQDSSGQPIYHTNVLLSVGENFAILCPEVVVEAERSRVRSRLAEGRELLEISLDQIEDFCGNVLELETVGGSRVIAMSTRAYESFQPEQRTRLEHYGAIVAADVGTIERHGGGSVRCMLAEIFLPLV